MNRFPPAVVNASPAKKSQKAAKLLDKRPGMCYNRNVEQLLTLINGEVA